MHELIRTRRELSAAADRLRDRGADARLVDALNAAAEAVADDHRNLMRATYWGGSAGALSQLALDGPSEQVEEH